MASILTLTLNPAIDTFTTIERMEPVNKLRCGPVRRDPGGGGINVARVLHRLGADVVAVYTTGGNFGAALRQLTEEEGVEGRTVEIAEETRENFTVFEEATHEQYRMVVPGPGLTAAEVEGCLAAVRSFDREISYLIASGSLPPGVPDGFMGQLADIAKDKGAKFVVDGPHTALAAALGEGCHMIKPNLREMRDMTGLELGDQASWIGACRDLIAQRKVEVVALSLAHYGALVVTAEEAWHAPALEVPMVSAVGAGDSFLGALVWALGQGHDMSTALAHGVAGGSAALLTPATDLCLKEDLIRLLDQVRVQAV